MSLARASARRMTKRGSPSYGSPPGFSTSQNRRPTLWVSPVRQGRILNVDGSGMAIMSDSSIRLKPVIDEPSKPIPSSSAPAISSRPTANDFSWPKMSVNQRRTNSTFCSSTCASTASAPAPVLSSIAAISAVPFRKLCRWPGGRGAPRVRAPPHCQSRPRWDLLGLVGLEDRFALLSGADAYGILDRQDEDLSVADRTAAGVAEDRLPDHPHVLSFHDDLELELRPQVDRELRAAIVLGDPLLPAGALRLDDREAREARLEQLLTDAVEGLVPDVGDDHLHAVTSPGRAVAPKAGAPPGAAC